MTDPVIPDYTKSCVTNLTPALLGLGDPAALPAQFGRGVNALLVLDGLGWEQLEERRHLTPNLNQCSGGPITTVAPSTTAAALTSITTALPPGEHGLIGYRMVVDGDVFNCLRWGTSQRPDCRKTTPASLLQPYSPFLGEAPAVVTKADFRRTGFTEAHLRGGRLTGYRTLAILVHEVARLAREGERAIYAYYDGIDKVAHEYGLGSEYDAELAAADRLVGDVLAALPSGSTVMVSADHGQVDCGDRLVDLHPEVSGLVDGLSGEGRFRWLHARHGATDALLAAAAEYHGHQAWVRSADQIGGEQWFGQEVPGPEVRDRLGDVALVPFEPMAFADPADTGPFELIGRHGSLTSAEMYVPCLTATV
jgi:hypothetical protein